MEYFNSAQSRYFLEGVNPIEKQFREGMVGSHSPKPEEFGRYNNSSEGHTSRSANLPQQTSTYLLVSCVFLIFMIYNIKYNYKMTVVSLLKRRVCF